METGEQNPQEKEAVHRYRLHMVAVTRTGTGKMADENGERIMGKLRSIAATTSVLLYQKGGAIGEMLEVIGGILHAPHIDGDRIRAYLWMAPSCLRYRGARKGCKERGAIRDTDGRQYR